jgi:hypothetical protein
VEVDTDEDGIPDAEEDSNRNGDLTDDDADQDGVPDFIDPEVDTPEPDEQPAPSDGNDTASSDPSAEEWSLYLPLIQ